MRYSEQHQQELHIASTTRPTGASWRAGTPSSSRRHRAYSGHRRNNPPPANYSVGPHGVDSYNYAITDGFLRFSRQHCSAGTPPPDAAADHITVGGLSVTREWLNPWRGSARSPGGTYCAEELQGCQEEGLPGGAPMEDRPPGEIPQNGALPNGVLQEGVLE